MRSLKSILKAAPMKYLNVLLFAGLLSGLSCKNSSNLDPSFIAVPAGFSILPGIPDNFYASSQNMFFYTILDSASHCDTFHAKLSDKVSWNVDLLGLSSGAVQRISGTSDIVDAVWCGGNDGISFFRRGEQVEATLSFYGTDLQVKDTITIVSTKIYNDIKGTNGVLVSDCEGGKGTLPSTPNAWYNFHDPTGSGSPTGPNQEQIYNAIDTTLNAVQGKGYYYMDGVDRPSLNFNWSTFFIEGAGFDYGKPILGALPIDVDPENLYFNVYVYGFGLPNTKFQVGFDEDDNGNNIWDPFTEDEIDYIIRVDWVGWRLVTFKYTDAKFSNVDPGSGAHGNRRYEPKKITKMGFVMNTDPALFEAKVAFDFPCFTVGHPFSPNR
jgi:hypothetical protein